MGIIPCGGSEGSPHEACLPARHVCIHLVPGVVTDRLVGTAVEDQNDTPVLLAKAHLSALAVGGGGAGALSLLRGWERGAEWQRRQLQEPREAVASLM